MQVVERRTRAMGSELQLVAVGGDAARALDEGERNVRRLENLWSRYLPHSEVSEVNRNGGVWRAVSPDTFLLFSLAAEGIRLTDGLFHPLPAGPGSVHLDADSMSVMVDSALDPNGIGKGLAADLASAGMLDFCDGALASIGGDLRARGEAPTPAGWVIAVEDPTNPDKQVAQIRILDGAVVTSSTRHGRRRDRLGERIRHVVDPRTGHLLNEDLTVTVVAADGWVAEVFATAALVAGEAAAIDLLDEHGLSGLAVGKDGLSITSRIEVFA